MYSTHNEGKSVVTERFIRVIQPIDVKDNTYIDFGK